MESCARQSIRHCLQMLAPFAPLPDYPEEGQRQLYDFFHSLYQGMLLSPEEYYVFPDPYEEYMEKNRKRLEEKRGEKNHYSDSRESTLRNTFQQAIQFYAVFLYELGIHALPEESGPETIALSIQDHQAVLEKMARQHGSQWNVHRYHLMEKWGLQFHTNQQRISYTMQHRPRFMEGLMILCRAKENKYQFMNYLRLDFQNAGGMPDFENILLTLPEKNRISLRRMQETIESLGIKTKGKLRPLRGITSDFQWKMEFACKGKNIWGFYADHAHLKICLYFNTPERISTLAEELMAWDPALLAWYQDQFSLRLCKCRYNRAVHLGNMKKRICGLSNRLEMDHPTPEDVSNAQRILQRLHTPSAI